MKSNRLELSSEQSLRLEEMRAVLTEALPAEAAEDAQFPAASFYCLDCNWTCTGTCVTMCDYFCSVRVL